MTEQAIEILFSAAEIRARIDRLAAEIAATSGPDLLIVPILKGSFVFAGDLIRALHAERLSPQVDFIFLSSYGDGTSSSGRVQLLRDLHTDVAGREVLILDDILESGRTLGFARDLLRQRGASSVKCGVLLDKQVPREAGFEADYCGFQCPDLFIVGYGMDLAQRYRELPYIGYLAEGE
jgi:hypoxanthine phosphoribosyltransferase